MSSNDQNSSIHKTSAVPPSVKTPSDIGAESSLASLRTLLTGLQTVIDQTGSYIFTKDLQGRYTYVNQKIQDLFGASYHDIVGKDDSHFFDIALSNELQINDRRVIDLGETIECEERNILKPSGNEQFFWSIKKPVRNEQGQIIGMCGISTDITARKQSDEALQKLQSRFEFLLKSTPAVIYAAHTHGDYDVTFISENINTQLGYQSHEFLKDPTFWINHIHSEDQAMVHEGLGQLFETGFHEFDYRFQHKDGSFRWMHDESALICDKEGKPLELIGYWIDITPQKIAEEKQRDSTKFLKQILDNLFCYVGLLDINGIIQEVNNAPLRQAGIRREDVIGLYFSDAPWWTHDQAVQTRLLEAIEAAKQGKTIRYDEVIQMGNDLVTIDFQISPVFDDYGEVIALLPTGVDISARKQVEESLNSYRNHLEELVNARTRELLKSEQAKEQVLQRLKLAAASGQVGIWDLNLQTNELIWDDTMFALYGSCREDFSGAYDAWSTRLHPDDKMTTEAALQDAVSGKSDYNPDFRVLWANGEVHYIKGHAQVISDNNGKPFRMIGTNWDNSAHAQTHQELLLARAAINNSRSSFFWITSDGLVADVNDFACQSLGYTRNELLGLHVWDFDPYLPAEAWTNVWTQFKKTGKYLSEGLHRRKDGTMLPVEIISNYIAINGEEYSFCFVNDITERKHAEEAIHLLAFNDPLTKLPNRRLLIDRLNIALLASERNKHYGGLLFLDMDNFKTLNDTFGHQYGDLLLIEVALRLKDCVRETDTVARFGGDEFVILLENISEDIEETSHNITHVAEKIRTSLSAAYHLNEYTQRSFASIGVYIFYGNSDSADELLKRADMAMYQAKNTGRNKVQFFDPLMQQAMEMRAALESDLREAIVAEQLQLFYQIQVDQNLQPCGAEALIRWIHPQRGIVSPTQFIAVAEESSLILEVGYWVLDKACQQLAAWSHHETTRNLTLAVNVSAGQFKQSDFLEQVKTVIDLHGVNPSHLKFELTENVALDNLDFVIAKMMVLKEHLGVQISLDDFGTGYSSLSYLKRLPLNQIKIDQSFVQDMSTNSSDAVMVKAIIELAKNFDFDVIAEGVETAQQLALLRQYGCMSFQGYLFSKPVPLEEFEALLKTNFPVNTGD